MKLSHSLVALFVVAGSLLAGCANPAAVQPSMRLAVDNRLGVETAPAAAILDGSPAFVYVTPDSGIVFQHAGRKVVLNHGLEAKGGKFLQIHVRGNHVMVAWWNHEPSKSLYVTRSIDGGKTFSPPVTVQSDHGVLPPITFAFGPKDQVGAVYSDERVPQYSVYFNRSEDFGSHWLHTDQRLDPPPGPNVPSLAYEPQLSVVGSRWVLVWRDAGTASEQNVQRILSRVSTDDGKTWSASKVIYTSHSVLSALDMKAVDGRLALVYAEGSHIGMLLGNANGEFGSPITVPGPESNFSGGFQIAGNGKSIVIVWNTLIGREKPIIMAATYDPAKSEWLHGAERIDGDKPNNTMSLDPQLVSTAAGVYLATWVDFRNIVPNIYVSTSSDQGVHWSRPRNVAIDGADFMTNPRLLASGKGAMIYYEYSPGSDRNELYLTSKELEIDAKGDVANLPQQHIYTESEKKEKLIDRVRQFWKLRAETKFDQTYPFFDPAMRAAISAKKFDEGQAQIAYWDVKDLRTDIVGNVATVLVNAHLKIQPLMVQEHKIDIPERVTDIKATWVWIKDNWYLSYLAY